MTTPAIPGAEFPDRLAELFLTDVQLALRWGISVKTIRNWRADGIGPAHVKLNGAVRYRLTDIIDYERARTRFGPRR